MTQELQLTQFWIKRVEHLLRSLIVRINVQSADETTNETGNTDEEADYAVSSPGLVRIPLCCLK